MLVLRKALKKAQQTLDNSLHPTEYVEEDEIMEEIPKLYPKMLDDDIYEKIYSIEQMLTEEPSPLSPEFIQNIDFDPQRIAHVISSLDSGKAAGPSSIGPEWLKVLTKCQPFLKALQDTFTTLTQHPSTMQNIPELY